MTDELDGMTPEQWEESRGLEQMERGTQALATTTHSPAPYGLGLLDTLDRALIALSGRLPVLAGDPASQAAIHVRLEEVRRNIGVVTDQVAAMLYAELPERELRGRRTAKTYLELDGVGVVEPIDRGGRWTDVNYEAALVAVFTALEVRGVQSDGEVIDATDLAHLIATIVGFSSLKSNAKAGTGLAGLGLTREQFGTWRDGVPGIRIIPAEVKRPNHD